MIRLLNIKVIDDVIKCDYIPEDAEISTPIEYDIKKDNFVKFSIPKGYEYCKGDEYKISRYFRENIDDLHEKATIMWY